MESSHETPPAHKTGEGRRAWSRAAQGFILGTLGWMVAHQLNLHGGLPYLAKADGDLLLIGLLAAVLSLTRLRPLLWFLSGALCLATLFIAYTPWIDAPFRSLVERDPPRPCEAVVVLSADVFEDGSLNRIAYDRVIRGIQLVRQGYAKRLVLTRLPLKRKSSVPAVKRELRALRFDIPIDEVGPVRNTHDEALAVKALAQERGWQELLLVTSPSHTRRARATFLKAGVPVLVQPCDERRFDLDALPHPEDRLAAFRDWLYEATGWQIYRLRGRL
jgi:uncharacterized SAM-binding protein YcdF (DUF218 family)